MTKYLSYLRRLWPTTEPVFRWGILIFLAIPLLLSGASPPPGGGDTEVYKEAGEAILAGQVPYRDFLIEYPPGALPSFVIPAILSTLAGGGYDYFFATEMAALLVATMFVTAATSRRLGKPWLPSALVVTAGFLLLLWPQRIPNSRYDAVVAFALAGVAWATAARHLILAWAILGFGTLAKLTPVLVGAALYPIRRGYLQGTLVFVGVLLAGSILAFLASPRGFSYVFFYHAYRGLQTESFAASILIKLGQVEEIAGRYGALEAVGGLSEVAASAALPVTLSLLFVTSVIIWREARRGRLGPAQFPRYAAALLLAFLVGSKVLSPQYLIWLLPLVPLAFRGVWDLVASVTLLLACWLTARIDSNFYPDDPAMDLIYAGLSVDIQRYLSVVGEASLYGIHPLDILLGRNILLLILWLAMLLAPAGAVNEERHEKGL